MRRWGLRAALLLVVAVNLVVLGRVWWNRTGPPTNAMTLTERELALDRRVGEEWEDTGVALLLLWQRRIGAEEGPGWFDARKLAEAGFDTSFPVTDAGAEEHYERALPRELFAVLEHDGEAWRLWQAGERKRLEGEIEEMGRDDARGEDVTERRARRRAEIEHSSRLVAVDVGRDAEELRRRYPDLSRHLIVPAVAWLGFAWKETGGRRHSPYLSGSVRSLRVESIHVPRSRAALLSGLPLQEGPHAHGAYPLPAPGPPRYEVDTRWGRRYEPWVAEVRPLAPPEAAPAEEAAPPPVPGEAAAPSAGAPSPTGPSPAPAPPR